MVFSAHPDDLEIGCAGSLRRWQQEGAEIFSIITVRPSEKDDRKRTRQSVLNELHRSYDISGWNCLLFNTDTHGSGRPNLVCDNVTMSRLSDYVADCDLAILPNPEDSHQDHRNTYSLVLPLLKNRAREIWTMKHWPYEHWHTVRPQITIDISEHWKFKLQLLECYSSYLGMREIQDISISNQYAASKIGARYAETFNLVSSYE